MWKNAKIQKSYFLLSSIPLENFWNFSHYKLLAPTHWVKEACSWLSITFYLYRTFLSSRVSLSSPCRDVYLPPPTTNPHRTARPAISNKGRVWLRAWERGARIPRRAGRDLGDVDREPRKGHVGRISTLCFVVGLIRVMSLSHIGEVMSVEVVSARKTRHVESRTETASKQLISSFNFLNSRWHADFFFTSQGI